MAATPKMQFVAEPGVPQIVITREFDSPLVLLYRVHIDPELLVQWLGPRRLTTHVERWDIRDGGTWRYISRDGDSIEYGFHGVFHGTPSPRGVSSRRLSSRARRVMSHCRRSHSRSAAARLWYV